MPCDLILDGPMSNDTGPSIERGAEADADRVGAKYTGPFLVKETRKMKRVSMDY